MRRILFFSTISLLICLPALSLNIVSVASGNWTVASTWSGGMVPGAADNVTIAAGHTVTMNGNPGNCFSLTINGFANWTNTRTTNVGAGGLKMNNGSIMDGGGTMNVAGTFSVTGSSILRNVNLNITGTTFVTGTLRFESNQGTKTFTNVQINSGGTWYSTANETGSVSGNFDMYGGTVNGTATGRLTITGNLNIVSGVNQIARTRLTVNGTFNVTADVMITVGNMGGSIKTYNNLTINSGGTYDDIANSSPTITGNFTNNGSFNSGTGQYLFTGAGKTFGGTSNSIFTGILRCNGTYTNNGYVTIVGSLVGTGTWSQGSGILDINCTNANFTVTGFSAAGAGNTVIYSNAASLVFRNAAGSVFHNLTVQNGTKTIPAALTCNGNVTIRTSTSLDVSASNFALNVGGNWSDSGTFIPRLSTTTFNGAGAQTIFKSGGETFYNVIFAGAGTKTLLSDIASSTNVTINAGTGTVAAGAFNITLPENWTNNGGTFSPGTGTVFFTGTVAETIFKSGGENFNNITFSNAGIKNLLSPVIATGNVTLNAGSGQLVSNNNDVYVGGNWLNNSTFVPGTSTVFFNGTGAQTISKPGGETFTHIDFSNGGSKTLLNPVTMTGNLTINSGSGTVSAGSNDIFITGNWTNNGGTFSGGTATVNFNGAAAQTLFKASGETFNHLLFTNAGTKTQLSDFSASGNITIAAGAGALTSNSFNIAIGGNWVDSSVFIPGTGTVTFNGTAAQTFFKSGGETFNNLAFSGAGTKTFLCMPTVTGNVTINAGSGTVDANTFDSFVAGNWTNNGGTFSGGTTITTFNGTAAQTIFKSGGETFGTLVFANAGVKSLLSPVTSTGDFTINAGATFNVSTSNYQVSIGGNYYNNGTIQTQKGTILFNGTAAQTIGGSVITNFYNLSLNNNAGASMTLAANLYGTLTLSNGTFNTNGKVFTMVSNASGTARIAAITGTGDISGNVIVQRYSPGGTTGWAFWGSAISSGHTFSTWNDDFAITCASCPNGFPGGFTSIYWYDETAPGLFDDAAGYVPLSSIGTSITGGRGYWVYFGNGQTTTTAITVDVTGSVRKFNFNIPLTYTNTGSIIDDGWNLISNPYPSPIKWTFLKGSTANIDNAVYVYNPDLNGGAGGYATYVNGISSPSAGSGGITDTIPMCQAFYVHSTGATSLSATETNKVGGNPNFLKMSAAPVASSSSTPSMIRLNLDGLTYHDETVLYEQQGASDGFDAMYDAVKMAAGDPLAPWIAISYSSTNFQVNAVSPVTSTYSIPVKTITGYAGNFTISAADYSGFANGVCLMLYDRFTGVNTDLRNSSYTFYLADTTATDRFDLIISSYQLPLNTTAIQPSCSDPNAGQLIAQGTNSGPWNYYWTDTSGAVIQTTLNANAADTLKNISSGTFTVEVYTIGSCDNGITQLTVTPVEVPSAAFAVSNDTIDLSSGGTAAFTNTSSNAAVYFWDFGDATGASNLQDPTYTYTDTGSYNVTLIASSATSCTDTASMTVYVTGLTTGIKEANESSATVFTDSDKQIIVRVNADEEASISIYDETGRLVYKEQRKFSGQDQINVSALNAGIYLLQISGETTQKAFKLFIR